MNETVVVKVSGDCVMDGDDYDSELNVLGDVNKHEHCDCVVVEDIIIMME